MIHPVRKKKIITVLIVVLGMGLALGLALYALSQNINLYFTPGEVKRGLAPLHHAFRIGGLVKSGSVHYRRNSLDVNFLVTDKHADILVHYHGILPDLFKEGQGIVTEGHFNEKGDFIADQVLAKHGADYMPPPVKAALKS